MTHSWCRTCTSAFLAAADWSLLALEHLIALANPPRAGLVAVQYLTDEGVGT